MNITTKSCVFLLALPAFIYAQQPALQYFRPNNQLGLNIYENPKYDSVPFEGLKVRVGGNFTQDFQALTHSNAAATNIVSGVDMNKLIGIGNGFNLAMANLNIDAQLEDGIRLNLTMYLSSRHHPETWVKGGYVQIDKLSFLKSDVLDRIMKNFTIKAGDYEVDYGDQHFRRTDGGNAIYNPFIENYIMDDFATEIGSEIYFHPKGGFIAMVGITNGQLNPTVVAPSRIDSASGKRNRYDPAFHGKIGFDRQAGSLRTRLTASVYSLKSGPSNTLFSGDRTGSHYFLVMENTLATSEAQAKSGRFTPQYSQQVFTYMVNPFIKFKGLELFGTYEVSQGRTISEKNLRSATQMAADLIFRFPAKKENFWIGGRYNVLTAALPGIQREIQIERAAGSVGWFVTKNMMLKAEYMTQVYEKFSVTDIRSGGKINGLMFEATVAF